MTSRRERIVQALVDRLNSITIENGYSTDLGSAGTAQRALVFGNVTEVEPFVIVDEPDEDKDPRSIVSFVVCTLRLSLSCAPAIPDEDQAGDPPAKLSDVFEPLRADVYRCLLSTFGDDPILGIPGCTDLRVDGHTNLPWFGDAQWPGFIVSLSITYRHDFDDESTYAGSSA